MRIRRAAALFPLTLLLARTVLGQDSSRIQLGVIGIHRGQPGLVVVAGRGLDSVRTIVQRDLENSDRYTIPHLSDSLGTLRGPLDPQSLKDPQLSWVVELEPAINGVEVKLYDMTTATIRQQKTMAVDAAGVGDSRMTIHRVSDQVVAWIGGVGIAATRIAFKNGRDSAIWRIDSDGANPVRITRAGAVTITPAWSPDGSSIAYSESRDGLFTLYLQRLSTGTRNVVPSTFPSNSYGPVFSPDSKTLLFAHGPADKEKAKGFDIESTDISHPSGMCCAHRLTFSGTLADNFSPTYSPDGTRIAFESNRTGHLQIWLMDADGTGASQSVPSSFDANGRTLDMHTPSWSPDNTRIAFSGDTDGGGRQVFYWSVGSGLTTRITSTGRNEDASWAPDSRHLVFKSNRSGSDQLWIWDIESGNSRQLTTKSATLDGLRFAAWSRSLGTNP